MTERRQGVHTPVNVLITGAAGFIGSNFSRHFAPAHRGNVVLLDALTYAGNPENIAELRALPHVTFVHGSICDEELLAKLFREHAIDTVVNFAAESHVDRSIHGPDEFIHTNIQGTHSLLKISRAAWSGSEAGKRFHHVSTDEVYGSIAPDIEGATEESSYAPNSPYAASKAAADHLVRAYNRTYGLPAVTTNCSNNFGPYQFPEKLFPLAIVRALLGEAIPVYGDGRQIRDWLYVMDHCRALDGVLRSGADGRTYNIAGTGGLTNLEILHQLCDAVDAEVRSRPEIAERFRSSPAAGGGKSSELMTRVKDRPGHDRRYALDASRLRDELGIEPELGLEEGLALTVRWYADNEPWWRSVMDGSYRNWIADQYGEVASRT